MHPADCVHWDYERHPRKADVLPREIAQLVVGLRNGTVDTASTSGNPRPAHRFLFGELTLPSQEYDAGHYRGEDFRCLRYLPVGIASDPRVGAPPEFVPARMSYYKQQVAEGIFALDKAHEIPNARLKETDKLRAAVALATRLLERVLVIHPFSNGNGHAARFVVWAVLGRYGYWPTQWPMDPRPPDPPYTDLIVRNRNGDPVPLEQYILRCIIG